jgi:3-phosphoglycerate kinase
MTDSSSEDKLSNAEMMMAQDLMESKIREAKASTKMTDLLMIGNFRMELVPSNDRDNADTFRKVLAFLHDKYGEELLKTDNPAPQGHMHG